MSTTKHTPSELAEELKRVLRTTSALLDEIPYGDLAVAMTEGMVNESIDRALDRRRLWVDLFRQVASDMESQMSRMRQSKDETVEAIAFIKEMLNDLHNKNFNETVLQLSRFVLLLKEIKSFKDDGTLAVVAGVIKGHEVPAT